MSFNANGSGWPPDTNGDVGPNHYIQTVNTSVGIYNKTTGAAISTVTFNTFFTGPAGTPCDTSNQGDPVVLYDPAVNRWIVTDFAWFNVNTGPFYECIAVSQTGDPVAGGWYFYALQANTGFFAGTTSTTIPSWACGPTATTCRPTCSKPWVTGFGVRLWGINKTPLLTGGALQEVHFDLCLDGACGSFLPSNLRGTAPPAGAPNYFAQIAAPDGLDIYEFDADFVTPANSTLTGPVSVPIAPFNLYYGAIAQPGTAQGLDSLSFRLMMQLQYRNMGTSPVAMGHPHRGRGWAGRGALVRGARSRRHADPVPAGQPEPRRRHQSLDGHHRRRPRRQRRDRIQRLQQQRLPRHPLCRPPERRDPRPDAANRAGAGQRHRLADQHRPLGRLQRHERGPERRLHLLVHPGVLHRQRQQLADPHRLVQVPLLRPAQGHDRRQGGRLPDQRGHRQCTGDDLRRRARSDDHRPDQCHRQLHGASPACHLHRDRRTAAAWLSHVEFRFGPGRDRKQHDERSRHPAHGRAAT